VVEFLPRLYPFPPFMFGISDYRLREKVDQLLSYISFVYPPSEVSRGVGFAKTAAVGIPLAPISPPLWAVLRLDVFLALLLLILFITLLRLAVTLRAILTL
jgi:hypothetical protein